MTTNFLVYQKQDAESIPKYTVTVSWMTVSCFYGDADGYSSFTLKTDSERQLLAYLIELQVAMVMFPHGRGGCRDMYDYTNYFHGNKDADELCRKHKAFDWMSRIPNEDCSGSPYTIEGYDVKVISSDFHGTSNLDISIIKQIHTVMEVINDVHHFGEYTEWDIKYDQIGVKSAQGWLPMVLKMREDLLKEYDETMKERK